MFTTHSLPLWPGQDYQAALALGGELLTELKKMDDKQLLVEVQLLESKTYHSLRWVLKQQQQLVFARTIPLGGDNWWITDGPTDARINALTEMH